MLVLRNVGFGAILRDISCEMPSGQTTVLLGPSGSGKSTLLRLLNGLRQPTQGEVSVLGRQVADWPLVDLRRQVAFVSQQLGLFPHLTARRQITRFASGAFPALGLTDAELDRYPAQLSGGQRQRVALARALASNPAALLLDEPFSALDPPLRRELQTLIASLGKTIVLVSHDLAEAQRMAQHLIFLDQGGVVYSGPPSALDRCPHPTVRRYLAL